MEAFSFDGVQVRGPQANRFELICLRDYLKPMKLLILSVFLLITQPLYAEMYRWVDEKGNVHFSDKPVNKDAKTYNPPPIITVPAGPTHDFSKPEKKSAAIKYKISISSPSNDQTFPPGTTAVDVLIQLQPQLNISAAHLVTLFIDGKQHSQGTSLHYSLPDLSRGTHTASASVVDNKGKTIAKSGSVSFHVIRHHL